MSTEVKIGIRDLPREVTIDADLSAEDVRARVQASLTEGAALELTDERGRTVLVNAAALGYVEVGAAERPRVGFGEH